MKELKPIITQSLSNPKNLTPTPYVRSILIMLHTSKTDPRVRISYKLTKKLPTNYDMTYLSRFIQNKNIMRTDEKLA